MSANASEPALGSKPSLDVISTASPCIASGARVWIEVGVFGSVKVSKRGKYACSFSMEMDSLGIVSQVSANRGFDTHKISRTGGDAGQDVSTVTLTCGGNAATPAKHAGSACKRIRMGLILYPVMDS